MCMCMCLLLMFKKPSIQKMNKKFTYVKKLDKENVGFGPGANVYEECLLL